MEQDQGMSVMRLPAKVWSLAYMFSAIKAQTFYCVVVH